MLHDPRPKKGSGPGIRNSTLHMSEFKLVNILRERTFYTKEFFCSISFLKIRFFFLKDFIYLFLDRGEGREKEKHQCVVASQAPHAGDLAGNPGTCPDWESSQGPFGSQAGTQYTEPHQPA